MVAWLNSLLYIDPDSRELLQSTARRLVFTILGIHLTWHFTATLMWPRLFSPSLWFITLALLLLSVISLQLMRRYYFLSQAIWLVGLGAIILQAYSVYKRPEVLLLLVFLPLMAIATLRQVEALLVIAVWFGGLALAPILADMAPFLEPIPPIPAGYKIGVLVGVVFTSIFGWGLSGNLLSAISASNYHYRQARQLLEETRQHRGQISRMLKEKDQANYQLERLNQMLHQARKHADEARGDRDRFILAVSHELRSPLNFILGFSDLMVNSPEVYGPPETWPPGIYSDLQEIYRSSTHLVGLINDILDMGQIDARQMALFRETVAFDQVVEEVQRMVEPAFKHKGLWLRTSFEPDLPAVYVDCTRMRQVLLNLLNNSLRFTDQGGAVIRLSRQAQELHVTVEDTGSGITPEDADKVFEEFRQAGQDSWRRREGTGLGLSISRRFVQLHGGNMWLESELGRGTRITFSIPFQMEYLAPRLSEASPAYPILDAQVRQEQVILLLVEDPSAARLARQCLDGYRVIELERQEELAEQIVHFYPRALVISHILMESARPFLNKLPYELPVLILALPVGNERLQALPEGVTNYLVKPVGRQALHEALQALPGVVRSVLVVDDDPAMLRFVTQALRLDRQNRLAAGGSGTDVSETDEALQGYHFYTAASGEEALGILAEEQVDVILLDLDLPALTGWDVLNIMKENPDQPAPPIIVVSAHDMPPLLQPNGRELLNVWLNRSFTPQELGGVLKGLLENLQPTYRPQPPPPTSAQMKGNFD
jgi:signal transduction histidine kinase/response regulator of citrate/malate metabolism